MNINKGKFHAFDKFNPIKLYVCQGKSFLLKGRNLEWIQLRDCTHPPILIKHKKYSKVYRMTKQYKKASLCIAGHLSLG